MRNTSMDAVITSPATAPAIAQCACAAFDARASSVGFTAQVNRLACSRSVTSLTKPVAQRVGEGPLTSVTVHRQSLRTSRTYSPDGTWKLSTGPKTDPRPEPLDPRIGQWLRPPRVVASLVGCSRFRMAVAVVLPIRWRNRRRGDESAGCAPSRSLSGSTGHFPAQQLGTGSGGLPRSRWDGPLAPRKARWSEPLRRLDCHRTPPAAHKPRA